MLLPACHYCSMYGPALGKITAVFSFPQPAQHLLALWKMFSTEEVLQLAWDWFIYVLEWNCVMGSACLIMWLCPLVFFVIFNFFLSTHERSELTVWNHLFIFSLPQLYRKREIKDAASMSLSGFIFFTVYCLVPITELRTSQNSILYLLIDGWMNGSTNDLSTRRNSGYVPWLDHCCWQRDRATQRLSAFIHK